MSYSNGTSKIHANIRKLLKHKTQGLRCYAIRDLYKETYGKFYSESGFSARLREMADVVCNLSDYTYTINAQNCNN